MVKPKRKNQGFVYGDQDGFIKLVTSDWHQTPISKIENGIVQFVSTNEILLARSMFSTFNVLSGEKLFEWNERTDHIQGMALHDGDLYHSTVWGLYGPNDEVISELPQTNIQYNGIFSLGGNLYHIVNKHERGEGTSQIVNTVSGEVVAEREGIIEGMAGKGNKLVDFTRKEVYNTHTGNKIVNLDELEKGISLDSKSWIWDVLVEKDKVYFMTRNSRIYRVTEHGTKQVAYRGWNSVNLLKMNGKLYDVTVDAVIRTFSFPDTPTRTFDHTGDQVLKGRNRYGDLVVNGKVNSVLLYHPSAACTVSPTLVDRLKEIQSTQKEMTWGNIIKAKAPF